MLNNKKEGLFSYISFNQHNSCFVAIQNNKKVIINHSFPLMQPYVISNSFNLKTSLRRRNKNY